MKELKEISELEQLKMSKLSIFVFKFRKFIRAIPNWFKSFGKKFVKFFKNLGIRIGLFFKDLVMTFVHGDWKTKVSYFILGFGSIARGQVLRGLLFLALEIVFIWYMIATGGYYVGKLNSLGTKQPYIDPEGTIVYGDNSIYLLQNLDIVEYLNLLCIIYDCFI